MHRMILLIVLSISQGCGGVKALEVQLKDAQQERDVLRDAYEAQQLRLKELENRLLRLEDADLTPAKTKDEAKVFRGGISRTQTGVTQEKSWPHRRLRSLPIVMVKKDQINFDGERPRSESSDHLVEKRGKRRLGNSEQKESIRTRSTSKVRRNRIKKSKKESRLLSLNAGNLEKYRDPDRLRTRSKFEQERKLERRGQRLSAKKVESDRIKKRSVVNDQVVTAQSQSKSRVNEVKQAQELVYQSSQDESTFANPVSLGLKKAQNYQKQGRLNEAMRIAKRLIAESPTDPLIPDILYLMGRLQIAQGQTTAGRSTLLRLSRLYPKATAAKEAQRFLSIEGS